MNDALGELAERWRSEADVLRTYGEERLADVCSKHAAELEAAAGRQRLEAVTLEEAAEIGGYSYSHLQTLVAEGTIENVGSKGSPRIRRGDVPRKPGHANGRGRSKAEILDSSLHVHRGGSGS